jgi:hypothetical protein
MADQSAELGSEHPFTGTEPVCRISSGVAKKGVRGWKISDYRKYWDSLSDSKRQRCSYMVCLPRKQRSC